MDELFLESEAITLAASCSIAGKIAFGVNDNDLEMITKAEAAVNAGTTVADATEAATYQVETWPPNPSGSAAHNWCIAGATNSSCGNYKLSEIGIWYQMFGNQYTMQYRKK